MIIANYGNNCSGKTTFSAALATKLVDDKNSSCIIIDFNIDTPARAVWEPTNKVSRMFSLGALLEEEKIDLKVIPKYLLTHKDYNNIGLLGYCSGDTPISYEEPLYDKMIDVIRASEQMVDFVIVDCSSPLLTDTLEAAIEMSDCLNMLITPDVKGIVYYQTAQELFSKSPKFNIEKTNYILSPVKKWSDSSTIQKSLNNNFFELPYSIDIDFAMNEGEIFNTYKKAPKQYKKVVDSIIKSFKEERR